MIRRLVLLCLAASILVAVPAGSASACSCVVLDVEAALEDYDAAFVGQLVERPAEQDAFLDEVPYLFAVERWVKGDFGETMVVLAPSNGAACGFEVPIGQAAGIFVTFEDGTAHGGLCSTTDADSLLAVALDEPIPTDSPEAPLSGSGGGFASPDPGPSGSGDPDRWFFVLLPIVTAGGLIVLVVRRMTRRRESSD